jgi:cytochrome P450
VIHHAEASRMIPLSATTTCPDPRGVLRRLRREWGDLAWVELEPGVGAWLVMGYHELLTVARQEKVFSRDARNWRLFQEGVVPPDSGLGPMMFWRPNVIGADGAEHRRLRRAVDDGVAKIDQRRLRRSVEAMCRQLIEGFAGKGGADLVADYASVVPMLAIAGLFGLDSGQGHELPAALRALFGSAEGAQAANRRFEQMLGALLKARKETPADDLTSHFLAHTDLRDDAEVLQSMAVMISAAQEATTTWIAQTFRLMLTDPRFAGRLRGGRLGVDDALDEVLWRDPPVTNMPARYALRDTELGGRRIARGDALVLGLSAANDDPRVHGGATEIELGNRAHLAWSAGPHVCPAPVPARLITRTAVETALHLLPDVRLSVDADALTPHPSPWTRCPASLPVRFSALGDRS